MEEGVIPGIIIRETVSRFLIIARIVKVQAEFGKNVRVPIKSIHILKTEAEW